MKETVLCKSSAVRRKFLFEMKHTGFHLEMKKLTWKILSQYNTNNSLIENKILARKISLLC